MSNNVEHKYQNRLFAKLKNYTVIQSVLISTLLVRYNCTLEALALVLHINENKLDKVLEEKELLSEVEVNNLLCLFYGLLAPDS